MPVALHKRLGTTFQVELRQGLWSRRVFGQMGIGSRLGIGYAFGFVLTLCVGVAGLVSNTLLSDLVGQLHSHPFTVTNALRAAKGDAIEIRALVKDMTVLSDPQQATPMIAQIGELERDIEVQTTLIRERYLGDPTQVERMIGDYQLLKEARATIIKLVREGNFASARLFSDEIAAPLYTRLRSDIEPIMSFAERRATLFTEEAQQLRDRVRAFTWMILIGALAATIVAAVASLRSITRPLQALEASMLALAGGKLDGTIPGVTRADQIGQMAKAVQTFQEGLRQAEKLEQTLRQSLKLEAVGQLTGGVAHDFNNLLQVILTDLDLSLVRAQDDVALTALLNDAISEVDRGAHLTGQLLAFARRQPLSPASLRIDRLCNNLVGMLRRTLGEQIEIEVISYGGLWNALADANQLENAIINLAINARDAMPDGGKLTLELSNAVLDAGYAAEHVEVRPGQYVMLAMTDNGRGMTPEVAQRAFEPFFTTKPEGSGTGLGLSMVFGFVKQSEGHIKIYSEVGLGTTIKLYLPRTKAGSLDLPVGEATTVCGNGQTILVAEDDDGVRNSVIVQLAELGYRVLAAANGDEALRLLSQGERIDLLFTDVIMPGNLNGRALAEQARALIPNLPVVFTSGYTENAIIHNGRLDEGVTLLSKPYRRPQLAKTIHNALTQETLAAAHPPPERRHAEAIDS